MLLNAHTYHTIERNNGVVEPLRVVGALLPDGPITGIGWEDLHDKETIAAFTGTLREQEKQLGFGLMDHYELDKSSHDSFDGGTGYAFSHQTPQLRELAARACGLEASQSAVGLAHNFIESGVDINLLRSNPGVQSQMKEALREANITIVARRLADFFKASRNQTEYDLTGFANYVQSYEYDTLDGWVSLWHGLAPLVTGNAGDDQAIERALLLATELTADDYLRVLS